MSEEPTEHVLYCKSCDFILVDALMTPVCPNCPGRLRLWTYRRPKYTKEVHP